MRRASRLAVQFSASVVLWAGCGPQPSVGPVGDGVLVLEVGGDKPSLRASLLAAGRKVGPPRVLVEPSFDREADPYWPEDANAPGSEPERGSQATPIDPVVDHEAARPPVVEAPEPRWMTAELAAGETLIHLARRHLGDGRRYTDLLLWNGWSERDASRLPAGQKVKIMLPDPR